ncbi:S1C family serine protease [Deinococcus pimensis]|uniref:S1C family serine protease n=1 Tax=Deinococcus pimensis TaxID=309888 RepID=UPI000694C912|nr:trypsin-like peptidase domain-containing protein [Deinococcus pimensis]
MRKWPLILLPVAAVAAVPFVSPAARQDLGEVLTRAGAALAPSASTSTPQGGGADARSFGFSAPSGAQGGPDDFMSFRTPWGDFQVPMPQGQQGDASAPSSPSASSSSRAPRSAASAALEKVYRQSTSAAVRVNVGNSGIGSGFFLTSDGLVLTAAHVALGEDSARLTVTLDDGSVRPATLVGYDEARDVALLKVQGGGFDHLNLAASTPKVGDGVVAIGNSRGAFDGGRAGRVTGLNVSLDATFPSGLVSSSMPLAPGDSGGPVLDAKGEVVGVSTAISNQNGQFSSYFVPLTKTSALVADLRGGAKRGVPVIGVNVADAREFTGASGALVTDVTKGLGAQKAGLRPAQVREYRDESGELRQDVGNADVIVAVDGRAVGAPKDLVAYLRTKAAGDRVTLKVLRGGKTITVPVTLSAKRVA